MLFWMVNSFKENKVISLIIVFMEFLSLKKYYVNWYINKLMNKIYNFNLFGLVEFL